MLFMMLVIHAARPVVSNSSCESIVADSHTPYANKRPAKWRNQRGGGWTGDGSVFKKFRIPRFPGTKYNVTVSYSSPFYGQPFFHLSRYDTALSRLQIQLGTAGLQHPKIAVKRYFMLSAAPPENKSRSRRCRRMLIDSRLIFAAVVEG